MTDRLEDAEDSGEYWSYSKLQTIQLCGYRYWLKYRERVAEKKSAALLFGSDIHSCIEQMHSEGIWGEGQVQRFWSDTWLKTARKIDWAQEQMSSSLYKNRGLKMLEQYRDHHQDDVIVGSEIKFRISAADDTPPMQGIIDKIQEIEPGVLAVVDFKTSKNPPDDLVLRRDNQLSMYYLAAKELGYAINMFAIHHLLTGEVYWSPRTDEDANRMLDVLREAKQKAGLEMFSRNVDWHCKFCPYKEGCLS